MVGHFDGKTFKPKTSIIKGVRGSAFYAGQTFSDIPAADGRRIQIGVVQMDFPGAPFHFVMSLPLELKLHNTAEGIRMAWTPVKELETLRTKTHHIAPLELNPDTANPLASVKGELLELHVDFEPGTAETVAFNLHGATIVYASKKQELNVNGQTAPAPLINGRQHLAIYVDRTLLEVFAGDGLTYMTVPFIPKPDNQELGVSPTGGSAKITAMDVYELKSAWQ
jgi:sucrose-6-phosphate hydrolase SacC (GH32 family)